MSGHVEHPARGPHGAQAQAHLAEVLPQAEHQNSRCPLELSLSDVGTSMPRV